MKRKINILTVLLLTAALAVLAFGCNEKPSEEPNGDVRVQATTESITLVTYEVMGYDYESLFTITAGGEEVEVLSSYLNRKNLSSEPGEYTVSCTYRDVTATVTVKVVTEQEKPPADVYTLTLATDSVRVNADSVATYDFKALFTLKINGRVSPITDDMVTSNVKNAAGEYTYTVSAGEVSETLEVVVWEYPKVEMLACYGLKELPENEAGEFDFTDLFSLYLSGKAARVTSDMLEGVPSAFAAGDEFDVDATYTDGVGNTDTARVPVKIVAAKSVAVSCKDVTTYPNAEYIDLTTLFDITYGGERVKTSIDMISGDVDYTKAGENVITLTYDGEVYTAKVTVVLGVVIRYAKADTITVMRGTDQNAYPFGDDFIVTVNGSRFVDIEEFIDTSSVDFSNTGTYTATLTIPYNTKAPGAISVDFDYFEQDITYVVSDRIAVVKVKSEFVSMPADTLAYGINQINQNVSVTINGVPCILTTTQSNIFTNIYVEIVNGVDVENKGDQRVVLDLYVFGTDSDPERVTYTVRIASDITVTARDHALFAGGTVYARDLFEITENGKAVDVSEAEIEGKINVFVPGVYEVTATYEGITAVSRVTVFAADMQGTYKTSMTAIPEAPDDDDDDFEDLGWGDGEIYSLSVSPRAAAAAPLGDMTIEESGITVNGRIATSVLGIDSNVMTFKLGTSEYTMYLDNGIAVLDPDNSFKMTFSDYRRPMVYFSSALWTIDKYITINSGSVHVLQTTNTAYSIDCFRILPKGGNTAEAMWFGLKTHLLSRSSSDTIYGVTWGEIEFADEFLNAADYLNLSSSCVFDGQRYEFTMETRVFGKINKYQNTDKKFKNKSFTGKIDGKSAKLTTDSTERFTLVVSGKTILNAYGNDSDYGNQMVNGGCDYERGLVRLNSFGDRSGLGDDGVFSYTFQLDTQNNTFTLMPKDSYFGRYETSDGSMYIFLDGYGQGCISFDTSSFSRTLFTYGITGNEVTLRFGGTLPSFAYGDEMSLYIAPTLNVLSVKRAIGVPFGSIFTMHESLISDGAIVTVIDDIITSDEIVDVIYDKFTIIDKDGEWDRAKKQSNITNYTSYENGFYLVSVNVKVGTITVNVPYAFKVLSSQYEGSVLVRNYGSGVIYPQNKLYIDKFGRAAVDVGDEKYTGTVTRADGNGFTAKLHNAAGAYLCGVGELLADGIVKFTATGSAPFVDYFTTGTSRVIGRTGVGIDGLVLREFTVSGKKTYFVSNSATAVGEAVEIEVLSGSEALEENSVISVERNGTTRSFKIVKWGETSNGLLEIAE